MLGLQDLARPLQPPAPQQFGKSWKANLQTWRRLELHKWSWDAKKDWDKNTAKRFGNLRNAILCLEDVKSKKNGTLDDAAEFLVEEQKRLKVNITTHPGAKMKENSAIASRKRKKPREENNDVAGNAVIIQQQPQKARRVGGQLPNVQNLNPNAWGSGGTGATTAVRAMSRKKTHSDGNRIFSPAGPIAALARAPLNTTNNQRRHLLQRQARKLATEIQVSKAVSEFTSNMSSVEMLRRSQEIEVF
ncbi:unnamed protein product [Cylindrotheca closterium]|uniref:Uncharacterized protein n=1 Tax=Cylindrotheca closterium TaxID=2856 RepID=A0AAD2PVK0_9STRA|nr:unnamed protein product [Cylindrotheca closterium]